MSLHADLIYRLRKRAEIRRQDLRARASKKESLTALRISWTRLPTQSKRCQIQRREVNRMSKMSRRDGNKVRRADRQAQAKVRQEMAAKRTPQEQMKRLGTLPAKKERAKLVKRMTKAA